MGGKAGQAGDLAMIQLARFGQSRDQNGGYGGYGGADSGHGTQAVALGSKGVAGLDQSGDLSFDRRQVRFQHLDQQRIDFPLIFRYGPFCKSSFR